MTQHQRLKQLFQNNPNTWIPLPRITGLGIAMYPPRIKELRDGKMNKEGKWTEEPMQIKNICQVACGVKCSYYMYVYKERQGELL